MKKIIKTIVCMLLAIGLIIPVPAHAASLGISASTGTVKPGGSFTVYVSSSGGTGRVNIYVSNGSASAGSVWVENSSASVSVTAGSSGYCTVTATPEAGFSDEYGEPANVGSRSTSVAIKSLSGGSSKKSSGSSGSYEVEETEEYKIADIKDQTYTGKEIKPEVKVTCDGEELKLDKDYTVKYENNVNVGKATISVEGKGSRDFSLEGSFKIVAKDITKLEMPTIGEQRFTGGEIKPGFEIKDGETVLKEETDYTVTYENNISVGTATITITGTGNYTGTATIEFTIIKTLFDPGCSSHWGILAIALVGAALLAVFRKKANITLAIMAAVCVINTIVAFAAGNCTGEWVMAYFGLMVMVVVKWLMSESGMAVLEKIKKLIKKND